MISYTMSPYQRGTPVRGTEPWIERDLSPAVDCCCDNRLLDVWGPLYIFGAQINLTCKSVHLMKDGRGSDATPRRGWELKRQSLLQRSKQPQFYGGTR